MIRRKSPIVRRKRLPRSTKPIPKQGNPKRRKAREKRTRDLHKTPEYLAVRAEAMERAGERCEYIETVVIGPSEKPVWKGVIRCPERDTPDAPLHCHLESYGATGRLKASRAKILCARHHMLIESQLRPHNKNRLGSKASA